MICKVCLKNVFSFPCKTSDRAPIHWFIPQVPGRLDAQSLELSLGLPHGQQGPSALSPHCSLSECAVAGSKDRIGAQAIIRCRHSGVGHKWLSHMPDPCPQPFFKDLLAQRQISMGSRGQISSLFLLSSFPPTPCFQT